jgi:hypothetical protein
MRGRQNPTRVNSGKSISKRLPPISSKEIEMSDRQMSDSSYTHVIDVGIENVDIAEWLFNLPDAEYQRCSPDHIAAGATWADDGRRTSINVETIGR